MYIYANTHAHDRQIGNYEGFTSKLLKSIGIATRTAPRTTTSANALAWHRAEHVKELLTRSLPEKAAGLLLKTCLNCQAAFRCFQMLSVLSCMQCSAQVYRMRSVSISAILQGHAEHFHETVWSGFQVAKHNTRRTRTWDMRAYFLWIAEKQHVYPIPPIHSCHLKWPTDLPLQWNCLTSRIMPANAHCPAFRQLVTKSNAELRKDIGCRVVAFASRAHRHHQEGSKWNWTPWEVLGGTGDE